MSSERSTAPRSSRPAQLDALPRASPDAEGLDAPTEQLAVGPDPKTRSSEPVPNAATCSASACRRRATCSQIGLHELPFDASRLIVPSAASLRPMRRRPSTTGGAGLQRCRERREDVDRPRERVVDPAIPLTRELARTAA